MAGEAYDQTDVQNDPNWIRANYLMNRNPAMRRYGAARLAQLGGQDRLAATAANLERTLGVRQNIADENRALEYLRYMSGERDRQAREREAERVHRDTATDREANQRELRGQHILAGMDMVGRSGLPPDQVQKVTSALMAQYFALHPELANVMQPATVDPKQAAIQRVASQSQNPAVRQAAAQQPAGAPAAAGGTSITAAAPVVPAGQDLADLLGGGAPTGPAYGSAEGGFVTGGASDKERAIAAGRPYVEGGQVFGGPPGLDYNVSTGDWIPSTTEGTINGKPATQALVEGALKTGVNPIYSRRAMDVLDLMKGRTPEQAQQTNVPVASAAQGFSAGLVRPPEPTPGPLTQPRFPAPAAPTAPPVAAAPPAAPAANFNIHTGFTPEARESISRYLNLPGFPKHYDTGQEATFASGQEAGPGYTAPTFSPSNLQQPPQQAGGPPAQPPVLPPPKPALTPEEIALQQRQASLL